MNLHDAGQRSTSLTAPQRSREGSMTSLERQSLFLSASFPPRAHGQRFKPVDPGGIADAVTAIVRAVLVRNGRLLFGDHPTITPLVLMIASELDHKGGVDVFQSKWFERQITDETHALVEAGYGTIHWTPTCATRENSLHVMRAEMLRSVPALIAGVFVGGMEGIKEEIRQFQELRPSVPRISIQCPGGAAATLPLDEAKAILGKHVKSRRYPFVAAMMMDRLASRV